MQIELNEAERQELIELVRTAHAEVNPQLHHAMSGDYRDTLRARRALLETLLERLGAKVESVT
jgi:hypothetical protein